MGWTGTTWRIGNSLEDYLRNELTTTRNKVVFYSKNGYKTHFLGCQYTGDDGVTAHWLAVVLVEFQKDRWGDMTVLYKDMEESMGLTITVLR